MSYDYDELEDLRRNRDSRKRDLDDDDNYIKRRRKDFDDDCGRFEKLKRCQTQTIAYSPYTSIYKLPVGKTVTLNNFPFNNVPKIRVPHHTDLILNGYQGHNFENWYGAYTAPGYGAYQQGDSPRGNSGRQNIIQTIDIQGNAADYVVSAEQKRNIWGYFVRTGVVYLLNIRTYSFIKLQLIAGPANGNCWNGFSVRFKDGNTYSINGYWRGWAGVNQDPWTYIYIGNGRPALDGTDGVNFWSISTWRWQSIPTREFGLADTQLSQNASTHLYLASFGTITPYWTDTSSYYFSHDDDDDSNERRRREDYSKRMRTCYDDDDDRRKTRDKHKREYDDYDNKYKGSSREADKKEPPKNQTKISIPPSVSAKPQVVVGNNNTINNVSNVVNLNQTNNTTINSTVTNYIVNIGNVNKPESPAVQLPPPVNLASLISELSGSKK